ncbi:inositol monophosphatase family protein [Bacillus sp. FJAT-45066]|uniref:inositol monophosphatase family protein n=1 Tax=Bacillus sp. FJAT-45066 TaxID=2011010 RepID=UPI001596744E|nr:inositol monophosphatase family protein [Bacillus sp. FJAT-45066]
MSVLQDGGLDDIYQQVNKLIYKAGDIAKNKVSKLHSYKYKINEVDLVTEVDREIELFLIQQLSYLTPNCSFLTEETNPNTVLETDRFVWVIDPLDGTMNFIHGFPRFSISIALCKGNEVVLGFVLDVMNGQLYHAKAGNGAYRNDEKLQVSALQNLNQSLIAFGFSAKQWVPDSTILHTVSSFIGNAQGLRITGSSCLDLASVATGEIDCFWHYGLAPWDIAAGLLLVKEAGGHFSDLRKEINLHSDWIIASNGHIHVPVVSVLNKTIQTAGKMKVGSTHEC